MERYIGIDVHRDSSTICVLSATGKRVTHEVVATNGHALVSSVRKLRGTLHVCIEESTWSEWLYEILSPHASELVVYQNEWSPGAKSDAIDAHGLAEKLRIGQAGPGVFKSPKRYRQLREWARVYRVMSSGCRADQESAQEPVSPPWDSLLGNERLRSPAPRPVAGAAARGDATAGESSSGSSSTP